MTTSSLQLPPIGSLRATPPTITPVPTAAPYRDPGTRTSGLVRPGPEPVAALASTSRSWTSTPQTLPVRVACALWIVLVGTGAVGSWLVAAPGSGLVYRVATLGHPGLVLTLAGICVVTLLGLVPFTRGLTRAGGPELAAMTVAGIAGVGSLLGVIVLAVLTVLAGFFTLAAIVAVFERD